MFTVAQLMQRPVAVVGLGQIGMSWAAYFAAEAFRYKPRILTLLQLSARVLMLKKSGLSCRN